MISFTWILAIVSTLGIGGTIAAYFLFPAIVAPIIEGIVRTLLACKTCVVVTLVVILLVAVGVGSWWFGHHKAVQECRADELAAELRNKQADLDSAMKSAADEAARAKTIEDDANDQHQKDQTYIDELANRPAPACLLDDPDLGGMPNRQSRSRGAKPAATPK